MTKKTLIIWLSIVAILWTLIFIVVKWDNVPQEAKKTEKEVYLEKWTKIGEYKFDEQEAEQKRIEAKTKKDKLLEELNGTGFQQ